MQQWRFRVPREEEGAQSSALELVGRAWQEATPEQVRALFEATQVRADSVIVTRPNRGLAPQTMVEFEVDEPGHKTFGLPDVEVLLWGDEWVVVDKPTGIPGRIRGDDPTEPIRFMADMLGLDRQTVQPVWEMPTEAGGPWLVARRSELACELAEKLAANAIQTTWSAVVERPDRSGGRWEGECGALNYAVSRTEEGLAEVQLTPQWSAEIGGDELIEKILTIAAQAGFAVVGDARHGGHLVRGGLRLRLSAIYGHKPFSHSWPVPRDWWPEEPVVAPAIDGGEESVSAPSSVSYDQSLDLEFEIRLDEAIGRRRPFFRQMGDSDVFRVVHGAADGLSGIFIDRIGPLWRLVARSDEARRRREAVIGLLIDRDPSAMILDMHPNGQVQIAHRGDAILDPGDPLVVRERGLRFGVLPWQLDIGLRVETRRLRWQAAHRASEGAQWLHLFSHAGAFALALAEVGAHTTNVDPGLRYGDWLDANFELNGRSLEFRELVDAEVSAFFADDDRQYDGIIIDGPPSRWGEAAVIEEALEKIKPGGTMVIIRRDFSGDRPLDAVIQQAALDAGFAVELGDPVAAPDDFPVRKDHPEDGLAEAIWVDHISR